MGFAVICSGQAGQRADLLDDFIATESAGPLAEDARSVVGTSLAKWWSETARDRLFCNTEAQLTIALYQISKWRDLAPRLPPMCCVTGYSVGELVAYHVAGALDARETLTLVLERGRLMDRHSPSPGDGFSCMALWRGPEPDRERIETEARLHGLAVAIERGPAEIVLGGPSPAVTTFLRAVERRAGEFVRIPISVPSHTPWLNAAVAPFAAALERATFHTLTTPVVAGIDGSLVRTHAAAIDTLSRQLAETIRWQTCLETLASVGGSKVIELGPGRDLARLAAAAPGNIDARSAQDFRSAAGISRWVQK